MNKIILTLAFLLVAHLSFASGGDRPGLQTGIKAPDFSATNYKGEEIDFSDYHKNGPAVLLFYRGGWCKFCNIQLKEYQDNLEQFNAFNASIIAVSVDKVEEAANTVDDKSIGFEIISNPEANLLELYNVMFKVPDDLAELYKTKYNIDLEAYSGREDNLIAVPATYVIDQSGTIIFADANEDYKVRTPALDVLEVIKNSQPLEQ